MEKKLKCKECRHVRIYWGDPTKGFCIYGRTEVKGEEATTKVESSLVPATLIELTAEACEHFEPRRSHKEFIKEGF